MTSGRWALLPGAIVLATAVLARSPSAPAQQIGDLISPGRLARAHAALEGIANCQKCHEPGRKVTAQKCLACHQPIAARIAAKKGVHRDVKDECVSCHVDHAGLDADLRPLDRAKFDHAATTGFALDGLHAPIAAKCESCHKTRSFLTAAATCASCHKDVHQGRLGSDCAHCHSTSVAFRETKKTFDHSRTAFALTGAHAAVRCEQCHRTPGYRVAKFGVCNDCHRDPHEKPLGACASCHATDSWKPSGFDHAKTGFALIGRHAQTPCAKCHVKPATKVRLAFSRCADCHKDPHGGVFREDCASCHKETGFEKAAPFDHRARTGFPLDGAHASIRCASCHKPPAAAPGVQSAATRVVPFRGARRECAACHQDVHGGELGNRCETCHGPKTFRLATYQHPRFPEFFVEAHSRAPCERCHGAAAAVRAGKSAPAPSSAKARSFKGVSLACASCHRDPHAGELGLRCESCHTPKTFQVASFRHPKTPEFFAGAHAAVPCEKCHVPSAPRVDASGSIPVKTRLFKGVSQACASCHRDPHLSQLGNRCETCHNVKTFAMPGYRHQNEAVRAGFFAGRHAAAPCASCHKPRQASVQAGGAVRAVLFKGVSASDCASCHRDADVHKGALGTRCATCHSPSEWKNASRAFHKATNFPLDGKHLAVPCASCHWKGALAGTPTRCYDCHWIRRRDDRFQTRLGTDCENCHRTTSWTAVVWDHGSRTGFALNAAHRTVACESCHRNQVFTAVSTECVSCHRPSFVTAKNPDHVSAGFPVQCDVCHKAADTSWHQGRFEHNASFPLVGVHATQACAACHKAGLYRGTARDCLGCHKPQYEATRNPSHASSGFPTTCDSCHRPTDATWDLGRFDHNSTFALVGVHATQPCTACHKAGVYRGTARDCLGCHKPQYDATRNPSHASSGFSTTCDSCHRPTDATWDQGRFDHNSTFALVGVHATQPCTACHKAGVYRGTARDCLGCHKPQYDATRTPAHATAGFPTTCDSCHRPTDATWDLGRFDHNASFPLVGVHATQACAACHKAGVYRGTSRDCYGCHKPQYDATRTPAHSTAGFPTTCDSCHRATDATWELGRFDQSSTFPLVGVHATQTCTACHKAGVYRGTSRDCYGCHKPQYDATRSPPHASSGFPTTCDSCHRATDATWDLGRFDHNSTFPLVGVHATQPCSACHGTGVYRGTARDCYGCHKPQYDATRLPPHASAGFPTTCESCHRATDATWDLGRFDHNSKFPLVGVHATQPCSACHGTGVYRGTPRDCYGCHRPQYDASVNPNHRVLGFPTTCDSCHQPTDTTWQQGRFNHTQFPLTGPHAGRPCNACHTNPSNFATFTCFTCHDRGNTDSHHRGIAGYRYDSLACYACHPQGRSN